MSKSSRRGELSSRNNMALNPNSNREESHEALRQLMSAAASSSNGEADVYLSGRFNLRDVIKAPEVESKIDSMIKLLEPSVGSSRSNVSEKRDEPVADETKHTDERTINHKDEFQRKPENTLSIPNGPMTNGFDKDLVEIESDGTASCSSSVAAQSLDCTQPPLTESMNDQEFQTFLETDASDNPTDQIGNVDSDSAEKTYCAEPSKTKEAFSDNPTDQNADTDSVGRTYSVERHHSLHYHPLGGESLLRRALTGRVGLPGRMYAYGGVNIAGEPSHFSRKYCANIDDESSDVDVEMVDEEESNNAYVAVPVNNIGNPSGVDITTDSGKNTRVVRNSTAQLRKLSAPVIKKDKKKGFQRAGKSLENVEVPLSEMSKQKIRAFMKKESKKPQPDFIKLSEAMEITYDSTRKAMYDQGQVDVKDIKKKHPALLHYQMVKEELGRILKDPTKMERLEKELSKEVLSSALEGKKKTLCPGKKRHPIWKKTVQLWEENKGSANNDQLRKILGILAVCFEFAENAVVTKLCKILKQNEQLSNHDAAKMDIPVIVVRESQIFNIFDEAEIWIYLDGQKYIKVPNMYEAVLTVFATYYIFNIAYDKSLKSLFEFFDYLCDNPQSTYPKTH